MVIDVNNNNKNILNEKYSISPILNTYQLSNPNLLYNNINDNLNHNVNNNPLFTSWSTNKFNKEKNKLSKQNPKFFLPEINNQITPLSKNSKKNFKNNLNNNIDNQSTTNESKKNSNNTEEYSKDRIDLMSAKFISNINSTSNNIIIPMITLKRPNSNFNLGGNLLWEKMENLNSNVLNTEIIEKNNYHTRNNNNLERGKVSTAPEINNNIKLHKIKIEKGMMSTKIANNFNKNVKNFELNEYFLKENLYNNNTKNSYKNFNRKLPLKIKRENKL